MYFILLEKNNCDIKLRATFFWNKKKKYLTIENFILKSQYLFKIEAYVYTKKRNIYNFFLVVLDFRVLYHLYLKICKLQYFRDNLIMSFYNFLNIQLNIEGIKNYFLYFKIAVIHIS